MEKLSVKQLPMRSEKNMNKPKSVQWIGNSDGYVELIDQTLLPLHIKYLECRDVSAVVEAIKSLRVRGAPAIGIAGGYGVVVAAHEARRQGLSSTESRLHIEKSAETLASARPTAVNLRWAVERVTRILKLLSGDASIDIISDALLREARKIHDEDRALCAAIGQHGASILPEGGVLTHCNTGALATGGDGTALAVITTTWRQGRRFEVFADETRPLLQGARLTAWELVQHDIPVTVLVDAAAAHLMKSGRVGSVIVGADRITACGDTANKIGTYGLAVLAASHGIPFFVAAPSSTFDRAIRSGDDIPIEERGAEEVISPLGHQVAPKESGAYNPAFDVTPAHLIKAIITEKGLIDPVTFDSVKRVLQ